ncbi:hypothetical protein GMLC_41610 [Geomonas limicola]|uniref:Lipoprotein n=1 Tax=Geomonas limicola TaxID=2740186 RepID=A0A6V8ND72_9BACT|nr:hypothetical protein [Geomonas limicola]GFO70582.1 hypothetical protein GMLC_41610 [Geomonas limicola]
MAARLLAVLTVLLLTGCAELNDSLVRAWFMDHQLGNRVGTQIREGLKKREQAPVPVQPRPAPDFLDEG